ncbi:hypothetical protein [Streptomyces humi]|uniref:hypothetical protein n=1 Tax=Streptomyces humi TaxID=1428620 RepID=UPI0006288A27|nr:hypothetical protein [Streptomyces humi]
MARTAGYLANLLAVPPLIFRFQFNPELLSEKKSFAYRETTSFGKWAFDQTRASSGFGNVSGAVNDLKEIGSLLVGTKALEADTGKPRTFALDFALDARALPDIPAQQSGEGQAADDARFGGRIEPSLAVLRSFMNPAWDPVNDVLAWFSAAKTFCPPARPPVCTLKLGGIDLDCVMTDLNIKITKFKPDLTPERAEVSLTLNEQTASVSTGLDVLDRLVEVGKSYGQLGLDDWVQSVPGAGLVQNIFEL